MNNKGFFMGTTIALSLGLTPVLYTNIDTIYADNSIYEVTVSSLNMRSGPSTSYSVISKLTTGNKVEVYEISNGWGKVKYNDTIGYCSMSYLKPITTNNSSSMKKVNMDVYLRKDNNWSAEKLALIKKGESVNVISTNNDWTKVVYNEIEGYVASQYVDTNTNNENNSSNNNTSNDNVEINKTIKITTNNLNMRTGASTSYSVILTIPKGSNVNVISSSNGWDYVEYNNKKGYVNNKYLQTFVSNPPTNAQPEVENGNNKVEFSIISNKTTQSIDIISNNKLSYTYFYLNDPKRLVIDFENCNLKQGTDINNTVVNGSVIKLYRASYKESNNSTRLVLELEDSYDKSKTTITQNENKINIDFGVASSEPSIPSETEKNIYYTTADSLNVRSGEGTSYSIIGKLTKGTSVNVISISNGWAKIEYNKGYGYCSLSYLVKYSSNQTNDERINAVVDLAKKQIGKPYVYGASGPNSFDCSGFLYYIHKEAIGLILPRTSKDQSKYGIAVNKSDLKVGDLLFFDSNKDGVVNHAGMYIGDNQWIHSPRTGDVVKITKMTDSYVTKYLTGIRRVIN